MRDALIFYFSFGSGFYLAACLKGYKSFYHQGPSSITRGLLLGLFFWPLAILTWPLWKDK